MRIGIDFDNTLVCFDPLFHRAARERGLAPEGLAPTKSAVRDHLRRAGAEDAWTELQGHVYGVLIREAEPFPGAREFAAFCRKKGAALSVISHKTGRPARGEPHDLPGEARAWLEARGFLAADGFDRDAVFFEPTREAKLRRIAQAGCTHFIDDLEEVLREPAFPAGVRRWLFAPGGPEGESAGVRRFGGWESLRRAASEEIDGRPR